MSTREYRHIVIDDVIVLELEEGKPPRVLDDKRAKQMLRALGLTKEPVFVPNRSIELAKDQAGDDSPVTGIALKLLSTLAEYKDPLTGHAIQELMSNENPNTLSSRLSVLKKKGLVVASGVPSQYMVTSMGHAALVDSTDREKAAGPY